MYALLLWAATLIGLSEGYFRPPARLSSLHCMLYVSVLFVHTGCPAVFLGNGTLLCTAALQGVGRSTPAVHCRTAGGQWAVVLLRCTAALPWGHGQWNSCGTLPHYLGAVHSGTPTVRYHTALGQWAVVFLRYAATLHGGSGP